MRWLALTLALSISNSLSAAEHLRVVIDTKSATLLVLRGEQAMARFSGISIGRDGANKRKVKGDDRTPLGTFRIIHMNGDSRFRRFFRFNYPTLEHTVWAREHGIIDEETYRSITSAIAQNRLPPQDTPLGGNLGIHGLGDGDPSVHRAMNWTHGCVALTNEQIDVLAHYLRVGVEVVIE
jgi:murein L,D-transpeptidase YafK